MSDRRRNIFVLLLVVGPHRRARSSVDRPTKETKLGLDLQGGVQLVYEAQADQAAADGHGRGARTARSTSCASASTSSASPSRRSSRAGHDQIEVNLPGVDDAERAARQVGTTAQLYFYDWEPNVLDEDCQTNPDAGQRRPDADHRALQRGQARVEVRAAGRRQQHDATARASTPSTRTSKQPLNDGHRRSEEPRGPARRPRRPGPARHGGDLEVPEGILVVRNEDQRAAEQQRAGPVDRWWVLRDNPALSGTDIRNPEQNFDQQGGGEPIVTMEFTDKGREAFAGRHARDRPARRRQRGAHGGRRPDRRLAPLRDRARQRAGLDAVHQLPREPGRHRRRDRRPDLRRLHDPARPGPREPPQDRRAADASSS